ncbi:MAG TPA: POTRA domain-containing protein, partial [Candidatus Udaeobacter sp.]|nr:POTRA domain-containing protein [Candidatus Udaeobacter sp.]
MRRSVRALLFVAIATVFAARVHAAPARLEVHGRVLGARENDALFADALRAPGDSARTAAALGNLVARLEALGYLDAHARARWDSIPLPRLLIDVAEGPHYRLASVAIEAPSAHDSALFGRALALTPGGAASPQLVSAAIDRAVESVAGEGYPYAELGVRSWEADSGTVRVHLSGALGPRIQITRVRIEGLHVTREDVAQRALGHLTGMPYRRAVAEDARDRLDALGLFRSVSFEGLEGEGDWSRAHLVYRVDEPRYNEFEGALGVQGQAGTVGLLRLELQNLIGTGRGVGLRWESRGRGVSLFGAHASEPQLFGQPLRIEIGVDQDLQDTLYTRTRWGARGIYALSGRERIEAGFEEERVVSENAEVEEADLQNSTFAFERSTLDPSPGARRGAKVRLSATEIWKSEHLRPAGDRTARASAASVGIEWRHPVTAASAIDLAVEGAGRFSSQRVLPLFERYPIGGATTLRGYDEQQFRADRYALSRLEWGRTLGGALAPEWAYLFWDHAWMATRVALPAGGDTMQDQSRDGFGFGLRIAAGGGWMGLDYGLAPGHAPLE